MYIIPLEHVTYIAQQIPVYTKTIMLLQIRCFKAKLYRPKIIKHIFLII